MDLDNSFQEPDVSLNDILKAVKEQGDINSRLRQDLSQLRQEVQGSTLSVATQVQKFKTESEYKWKYEGNRVQFSLNSELLEDLNHTIWALEALALEVDVVYVLFVFLPLNLRLGIAMFSALLILVSSSVSLAIGFV
jgi:hypothetical protein